MSEECDGYEPNADLPPDPAITPELFHSFRTRRFGASNPERMNNPFWEWMVSCGVDAYRANRQFDLSGSLGFRRAPTWCFQRFGRSTTKLSDGRLVLIAGEHEDGYDPDFCIYNDVVVLRPDGNMEIFGYPREVFPPTDFHSATLAGDRIVIIGCLGYPDQRQPDRTPVFLLDPDTLAITSVATAGTPPAWIHRHDAVVSQDCGSILITGGDLVRNDEERTLIENIDDWRLRLSDGCWQRLTKHAWKRFEVARADRTQLHLWRIRSESFHRRYGIGSTGISIPGTSLRLATLEQQLGCAPDFELIERLFVPDVHHERMAADEEELRTHKIVSMASWCAMPRSSTRSRSRSRVTCRRTSRTRS